MIFKWMRLFLRFPSLEIQERKICFPIKEYRVWIYNSPRSFHTRNIKMVSQIQYDAAWKLFDTYLAGLNVASIK